MAEVFFLCDISDRLERQSACQGFKSTHQKHHPANNSALNIGRGFRERVVRDCSALRHGGHMFMDGGKCLKEMERPCRNLSSRVEITLTPNGQKWVGQAILLFVIHSLLVVRSALCQKAKPCSHESDARPFWRDYHRTAEEKAGIQVLSAGFYAA